MEDSVGADCDLLQLMTDGDVGIADKAQLPVGQGGPAEPPGGEHGGEAKKPDLQPELPRRVTGKQDFCP